MNRATRTGRRQLVAGGGGGALAGTALQGAPGRPAAAQDAPPAGATPGANRQGVVTVERLGDATIHSYTGPRDGVFVNTHVVESADAPVGIASSMGIC